MKKINDNSIVVISDTHDSWENIGKLCRILKKMNTKVLIHCGDVCAPITLKYILDNYKGKIYLIKGNVDGDIYLMDKIVQEYKSRVYFFHEDIGEFTLQGRKIAIQHYPKLAYGLACTGNYSAVFYGHTHIRSMQYIKAKNRKVLLANPGNMCNIKDNPSFGIYNPRTNKIEIIDL